MLQPSTFLEIHILPLLFLRNKQNIFLANGRRWFANKFSSNFFISLSIRKTLMFTRISKLFWCILTPFEIFWQTSFSKHFRPPRSLQNLISLLHFITTVWNYEIKIILESSFYLVTTLGGFSQDNLFNNPQTKITLEWMKEVSQKVLFL